MGLITSIGAGIGAAGRAAEPIVLKDMESKIQELRDTRLNDLREQSDRRTIDYSAQKKAETGKAIYTAQQGMIQSRLGLNPGEVSGNPRLQKFLDTEGGSTDKQIAQAGESAANRLGQTDVAREYGQEVRSIDAEKKADNQFAAQMRRADAALISANRNADRSLDIQTRQALSSGLNASVQMVKDTQSKINTYMQNNSVDPKMPVPAELKTLQDDLDGYKQNYMEYDSALKKVGGIEVAKPAAAIINLDAFNRSNKPQDTGGAQVKKSVPSTSPPPIETPAQRDERLKAKDKAEFEALKRGVSSVFSYR